MGSTAQCGILWHESPVELLWAAEADVNNLTARGESPLLWAAAREYVAIAKALLIAGVHVSLRDSRHWSALDYVAKKGHVNVMR